MGFENKTALVTGGSRGLGKAIALELARHGCNVYFNYVSDASREKAEAVAAEIHQLGRRCLFFQVDVSRYDAVKTMADKIVETEGKIDFLVNNAGINHDKPLMTMSPEEWQTVIDTNLTGTFNCTRAILFQMFKEKFGRIVNMSSVTGLIGMAGQTNYGAAKAGIIGFTKCLAKEVANYNITVNAVAPGFIETDMIEHLKEDYRKKILSEIPSGRFGTSEEVASLVLYLLSDKAAYITGQTYPIDGGIAI